MKQDIKNSDKVLEEGHHPFSCPSARTMQWKEEVSQEERPSTEKIPSELRQWPIKIALVHPQAPYFQGADLIVVADCVPFAYGNFHQDFIKGKALAIGCPKFDDIRLYQERLTELFLQADIKSVAVVHMEVPCCFGLRHVVEASLSASGKDLPYEPIIIGIKGDKK